nr:MAG TPA: hypothetical protein [Caudoviricetes sp.]
MNLRCFLRQHVIHSCKRSVKSWKTKAKLL